MNFEELIDAVKDEEVTLDLDETQVKLASVGDGIILATVYLGELPDETLPELRREMMAANHLFQETGGATLSLEPGTRHAFLQRRCQVSGEGEEAFLNHLAVLVQKAEEWKARIFSIGDENDFAPDNPDLDELFSGQKIVFRV
ncbi:MAG: type III secretion system chaperone [Victivallales bacterium]|nr:type III secretion system chaperone [Victivallales bacterium]